MTDVKKSKNYQFTNTPFRIVIVDDRIDLDKAHTLVFAEDFSFQRIQLPADLPEKGMSRGMAVDKHLAAMVAQDPADLVYFHQVSHDFIAPLVNNENNVFTESVWAAISAHLLGRRTASVFLSLTVVSIEEDGRARTATSGPEKPPAWVVGMSAKVEPAVTAEPVKPAAKAKPAAAGDSRSQDVAFSSLFHLIHEGRPETNQQERVEMARLICALESGQAPHEVNNREIADRLLVAAKNHWAESSQPMVDLQYALRMERAGGNDHVKQIQMILTTGAAYFNNRITTRPLLPAVAENLLRRVRGALKVRDEKQGKRVQQPKPKPAQGNGNKNA